jgi:hypothetical protein
MKAFQVLCSATLGAWLGVWFVALLAAQTVQTPPLPATPTLFQGPQQSDQPSDPTAPTPSRPWGRWDGVEGAYCLHGDPLPEDKNGHKCGCKLMCQPINDGSEQMRVEDHSCATYCRPAFKSCACHPDVDPEDPCGMNLSKEGEPLGPEPRR